MSYFNMVCDSCGREVYGCNIVNGMKFCAKCYQETFGASKDWKLLDKNKTIAEQQQRIAELEEQLANAIVPKFKIGQEVFYIVDKYEFKSGEILEIQIWDLKKDNIVYVIEYGGNVRCESAVFATKEEAQSKLRELQGEKK